MEQAPPHVADNRGTRPDGVAPTDTKPLAVIVASTIAITPLPLRARLLQRLLASIGPLALAVLAGGSFAKYLELARCSRISLSPDDAARVTSKQIVALVDYVAQSDPTVLEQVMVMLSQDATTMAAMSASVAAIAVKLAARRKLLRDPIGR